MCNENGNRINLFHGQIKNQLHGRTPYSCFSFRVLVLCLLLQSHWTEYTHCWCCVITVNPCFSSCDTSKCLLFKISEIYKETKEKHRSHCSDNSRVVCFLLNWWACGDVTDGDIIIIQRGNSCSQQTHQTAGNQLFTQESQYWSRKKIHGFGERWKVESANFCKNATQWKAALQQTTFLGCKFINVWC